MRMSDWSSDVCSSDLLDALIDPALAERERHMEAAVHHRRGDGAKPARAQRLGRRDEVGGGIVHEARDRSDLPHRLDHRVDLVGIANITSMPMYLPGIPHLDLGSRGLEEIGRAHV